MRNIKIYDLTFSRSARFAPERYKILRSDNEEIGYVELWNGLLTVQVTIPTGNDTEMFFRTAWEISDLNMFHSNERRDKWLTIVAEKIKEAQKIYGQN